MLDRLQYVLLWTTVMSLIAASGVGSLLLCYGGLLCLLGGQSTLGAGLVGAGLVAAAASYALCRHANDLIDR